MARSGQGLAGLEQGRQPADDPRRTGWLLLQVNQLAERTIGAQRHRVGEVEL
jgi:hypothetical protein